MDGAVLIFIQEYIRSEFLTPVMKFITHTGDAGILWIASAVILLMLTRTRKFGAACAVSLIIEVLLNNVLLKNLVARTRPYEVVDGLELIIEKQSDYSFPSGHSGASFAFAGAMLFFIILKVSELAEKKSFRAFCAVTLVYAALISLSRLYVGVHYPTDVLAGAALGFISGYAACLIVRKIDGKMKAKREGSRRNIPAEQTTD